jgi:hypothetical protein
MTLIKVQISESELHLLRQKAAASHQSTQEVLRQAIRLYLASDSINPDDPIFHVFPLASSGRKGHRTSERHDDELYGPSQQFSCTGNCTLAFAAGAKHIAPWTRGDFSSQIAGPGTTANGIRCDYCLLLRPKSTELLHHGELVGNAPVFDDASALQSEDVDYVDLDLATGSLQAHEFAAMSSCPPHP